MRHPGIGRFGSPVIGNGADEIRGLADHAWHRWLYGVLELSENSVSLKVRSNVSLNCGQPYHKPQLISIAHIIQALNPPPEWAQSSGLSFEATRSRLEASAPEAR